MLNILYTLIIYPITQVIEFAFMLSLDIFKNTGVAVLGVSFAVSILCLPLYIVAENWSEIERNIQNLLAADVTHIKKSFKGDEQYLLLSTLYRENHYHPLMQLRSSFGLLIQIPFFIAAYHFLSNCPALKGQRFLFIRDMGSPDSIFSIGSFSVNILPILMTAVNLVSGVIYSKGHGLREKIQIFVMALIFLIILYSSPSGLVVYWLMNNVFSLVKNIFYKLKHPAKVLYALVIIMVAALDCYILFVHKGPIHKRALLAIVASLLLTAPLFIKAAKYLLDTVLQPLVKNNGSRSALFLSSSLAMFFLMGLVIPTLVIKSSVVEFTGIDGYKISHFITTGAFQSAGIFLFWAVCVYFLFSSRVQAAFSLLMCAAVFVGLSDAFIFYGSYPTLSRVLTFASSLEKQKLLQSLSNIFMIGVIFLVPLGFFILGKRFKILLKAPVTIIIIILSSEFLISVINIAGITNEESVLTSTSVTQDNSNLKNNLSNNAKNSTDTSIGDSNLNNKFHAIYHFSKTQKNVVLLMLDRAQSAYLPEIFAAYPDIAESFSGFVYYPNCASYNQGTILASPALFGGYEYTPLATNSRNDIPLVKKHNEAISMLPTLFYNNGYSATVADLSWANYQWIPDLSIFDGSGITAYNTELMYRDDWIVRHPGCVKIGATAKSLERNILWFSFFKVAPLAIRDSIYHDGSYWASDGRSNDMMEFLGFYSALDYLPYITDFDSNTPAYFTIVNDTTHSNITLKAPDYIPGENNEVNEVAANKNDNNDYNKNVTNSTQKASKNINNTNIDFANFSEDPAALDTNTLYSDAVAKQKEISTYKAIGVNVAVLRMAAKWLRYLKDNGVYDNTRIIIASDHGIGNKDGVRLRFSNNDGSSVVEKRGYMGDHNNPLLLFKDFDSNGPLVTDNTFMTNADAPTLLTNDLIINARNPFTQKIIADCCTRDNGEKVARGVVLTHNWRPGGNGPNTFTIPNSDLFDIKRNIFDYKNWEPTKLSK